MSIEIELKFRATDHESVKEALNDRNAVAGPRVEQVDIYYNHPSRDFRHTNEAFRIRRVGTGNALTYKGPKQSGPAKTREEIEIDFEPGSNATSSLGEMLERLGFRHVAEVRKWRTPYRLELHGWNLEIALDETEDLGNFVEIEAIADTADQVAEAQAKVLEAAAALQLSEVEHRSYLRMNLELKAGAREI